jgi:hypothetical protein
MDAGNMLRVGDKCEWQTGKFSERGEPEPVLLVTVTKVTDMCFPPASFAGPGVAQMPKPEWGRLYEVRDEKGNTHSVKRRDLTPLEAV